MKYTKESLTNAVVFVGADVGYHNCCSPEAVKTAAVKYFLRNDKISFEAMVNAEIIKSALHDLRDFGFLKFVGSEA
jgi:hypothetical protein